MLSRGPGEGKGGASALVLAAILGVLAGGGCRNGEDSMVMPVINADHRDTAVAAAQVDLQCARALFELAECGEDPAVRGWIERNCGHLPDRNLDPEGCRQLARSALGSVGIVADRLKLRRMPPLPRTYGLVCGTTFDWKGRHKKVSRRLVSLE